MPFLGRGVKWVAKAAVRPHQYKGLYDLPKVFDNPMRVGFNYVFRKGVYPSDVSVHTPLGKQTIHLYTIEDLMTANEIFARQDYYVDETPRVVLDFGSNIGMSILYFLTRHCNSYVYGYEPVPLNVERLHANLSEFTGRYEVAAKAVNVAAGEATFTIEATHRYGGIGRTEELQALGIEVSELTVECV